MSADAGPAAPDAEGQQCAAAAGEGRPRGDDDGAAAGGANAIGSGGGAMATLPPPSPNRQQRASPRQRQNRHRQQQQQQQLEQQWWLQPTHEEQTQWWGAQGQPCMYVPVVSMAPAGAMYMAAPYMAGLMPAAACGWAPPGQLQAAGGSGPLRHSTSSNHLRRSNSQGNLRRTASSGDLLRQQRQQRHPAGGAGGAAAAPGPAPGGAAAADGGSGGGSIGSSGPSSAAASPCGSPARGPGGKGSPCPKGAASAGPSPVRSPHPRSAGTLKHAASPTPMRLPPRRNPSVSSGLGSGSHAAARPPPSPPPSPPTAPGSENLGWAWLVEGILSQVAAHLVANSNVRAFRLTCRHWRAVADRSTRALSPRRLWPRELVVLFPRLQTLELAQCVDVRNRDLFVLANSSLELRRLTLGDDAIKPWVTNKGLASIGSMTSLRSLALHDCNSVTNNGLAHLSGLSRLSSLSLRGCKRITNSGLEALQSNTQLQSLNLHGCRRISDRGLAVLVHLPLRALSLGLTRVRDEGMAHLAKLTQLTELHCTNEELTDEGIAHLSRLTELNTLALRDCCEVSGDALQALLPSLPHLAHLNLCKNWEFGDEQLSRCVVHMLGLRSLDLRGTWVTARGMAQLSQLTRLTKLALAPHVELKPEHAAVVAALTQLRSLTLSCLGYGPALMEALVELTWLKELNLSTLAPRDASEPPPRLAPHVYAALARMTGLASLDLSRRTVAPDALASLLGALPRLEALALHGCPLAAGEVAELEQAFPAVVVVRRSAALDASPELEALLGSLSIS
ncbi:hypothetical protein Rsub_07970 [Raphidocelis subcapitata]|uniref:F-box/LRR-repeat protein 15-like leucin rich repeat domain-containing protein n=1 Tax=Raphidocelis subcapitata TaxID=307507 RepID=A0A2V0P4K8_9CHLO|nr:hypothetical protein Rsub_07970 [Raphidocelis subcapitata]|eukprot:GBF94798.1 hypothetical protein Rsub_07970 [Raphidocelis subcapitata]